MNKTSYGFGKIIHGCSLGDGVEKVTKSLSDVGFGILTRVDVHHTLKEKLGADFRPYAILGACHPQLALQALEVEDQVGLLMPCNILVQERGDDVQISSIDPDALVSLVEEGPCAEAMQEAGILLRKAFAKL
tara:strand:- start:143 stop:538 length:396 start_codon:yes stop_codon:yes gene_type:complete